MRFQLFPPKSSKSKVIALVLSTIFLSSIAFSFANAQLWGIKKINEEEFKKIISKLLIYNDPNFPSYNEIFRLYYTDPNKLIDALNAKIKMTPEIRKIVGTEEDLDDLTYGRYILNAIYEEELIEEGARIAFTPDQANGKIFANLADNLADWKSQLGKILLEKILEGAFLVIGSPGVSIGVSTLGLATQLFVIGSGIKKINERLYERGLWHYLQCRKQLNYDHISAWDIAKLTGAGAITNKNEMQTEEYFKSLWGRYGENISDDGLKEDFKTKQRKKLKTLFLYALGAEPHPVISSPLKISPRPYYVGDKITAEFTITNKGVLPITFDTLTVGGRDPDDQIADFTFRRNITLDPNQSYDYKGTFTLTKAGKYHFFCAYQTPEGKWNTSIDLGSGLTDKDRVEGIDVKEKEESFWPKEKVPLPKSLIVGEYFKITIKSCEFLREGNLEFDVIFENLAEFSAMVNPTWTFFPERMPLVDNLGNSYPVFVLFPLEKRTLSRDTPWEFHIIFPKLKRESEAVVLYTGTSSGFGAGTGFPQESGLDYVGPIKLENIPTGKQSLQMISLPKTFLTDDKNWKIIVDSYQILEGRNLEFTLFIENLQEKMDKCKIADITFLVDNVNNKYYRNPLISVKTYKEFAPHVPTKVYVNFPEFDERAEAVTLYLSFKSYEKINEGWIFGPLKMKT